MKQNEGKSVGAYLIRLDAKLRPLAEVLRRLILEAGPVEETVKWGFPTYVKDGNVCSINDHEDYLRLQFFRGSALTDSDGLLEGTGKGMRHLKVRSKEDVQPEVIQAWVREAIALNRR